MEEPRINLKNRQLSSGITNDIEEVGYHGVVSSCEQAEGAYVSHAFK